MYTKEDPQIRYGNNGESLEVGASSVELSHRYIKQEAEQEAQDSQTVGFHANRMEEKEAVGYQTLGFHANIHIDIHRIMRNIETDGGVGE